MNELTIFNNPEFGDIRTVEIEGRTMFVAIDVARALGYLRPADAITTHCKGSVKWRVLTSGGEQEVKVIPEGDIYRLVIRSKLPSAEKFEYWVFDEVIPTIRQKGSYNLPQTYTQALEQLLIQARQNEKLLADNQIMQPKADFYDAVAGSKTAIEMGSVAKVLNFKGVGRNKLFEILRDERILQSDNIPYQKYIDNGWFRTIEQKYSKDGETYINIKTLVYQKGVDGIRKILEKR